NPGIAAHARCVAVQDTAIDALLALARRERVDLTVVGPEIPLALGLADRFRDEGLHVFGPSRAAARLESSKAFAKAVMARHDIPPARFQVLPDADAARHYCRALGAPVVVKADGLAGGKGALVCKTLSEADRAVGACLGDRRFGAAGASIVIEEVMDGEEASFFVLSGGASWLPPAGAQGHQTGFHRDRGAQTRRLGGASPAPVP